MKTNILSKIQYSPICSLNTALMIFYWQHAYYHMVNRPKPSDVQKNKEKIVTTPFKNERLF